MARNRFIPNFLYGTLGLAAVGAATYFALRAVRARREHAADAEANDSMLSLRRSTRKVGRTAKDSAQQIGKDVKRGVKDTGEALAEVGSSFDSPSTSYNRI